MGGSNTKYYCENDGTNIYYYPSATKKVRITDLNKVKKICVNPEQAMSSSRISYLSQMMQQSSIGTAPVTTTPVATTPVATTPVTTASVAPTPVAPTPVATMTSDQTTEATRSLIKELFNELDIKKDGTLKSNLLELNVLYYSLGCGSGTVSTTCFITDSTKMTNSLLQCLNRFQNLGQKEAEQKIVQYIENLRKLEEKPLGKAYALSQIKPRIDEIIKNVGTNLGTTKKSIDDLNAIVEMMKQTDKDTKEHLNVISVALEKLKSMVDNKDKIDKILVEIKDKISGMSTMGSATPDMSNVEQKLDIIIESLGKKDDISDEKIRKIAEAVKKEIGTGVRKVADIAIDTNLAKMSTTTEEISTQTEGVGTTQTGVVAKVEPKGAEATTQGATEGTGAKEGVEKGKEGATVVEEGAKEGVEKGKEGATTGAEEGVVATTQRVEEAAKPEGTGAKEGVEKGATTGAEEIVDVKKTPSQATLDSIYIIANVDNKDKLFKCSKCNNGTCSDCKESTEKIENINPHDSIDLKDILVELNVDNENKKFQCTGKNENGVFTNCNLVTQ